MCLHYLQGFMYEVGTIDLTLLWYFIGFLAMSIVFSSLSVV